jgi:hypothetical protein
MPTERRVHRVLAHRQSSRVRRERQGHRKLAALALAGARRADDSAVHLDQPPRQREPDSEPALVAPLRVIAAAEHLEQARQRFRRDSSAVIPNRAVEFADRAG